MPTKKQDEPTEDGSGERRRLMALTAAVGRALTTQSSLADMLRGCAEAMVEHLDAAFARIWTLNEAENILELQASAGLYTHLDGPHGRVPVGVLKIGLIAQERRPHLTNAVIGDPRVSEQEWAKREGMVSFAGYPLVVEDKLIGVAAMFARKPLSDITLQALGAVADEIAVGIERKRAEKARRESEDRFHAAFAHAAVGMSIADLSGRFLVVNPAYCEITGYSEPEILGIEFPAITHPDDLPANLALMEQLRTGLIPSFVIEKRYRRKDGALVWVQNSVALVRDALGNPFHTVALTEDITARKQAEAARDQTEQTLRESEARFRLLADAIPHIAWTTGPDGSVDYYNQRWYQYSGLTFEETRDWGWGTVIHPDDLERAGGVWRAAIEAGRTSEVEYRLRRADGVYRWHLGRSEPVRDEAGRIIRWVGTATDISNRKEAEEAQAALLQHEHTIAEQLQQALQPDLPGNVPGLKIQKYYEPALLEEAGVGGDFYDVFAVEKGCTALVVGDLSGKGLAAAAQVATVRNMLRAFLYSKPTVAEAVTDLNRVMTENNLLTGFATLFVGAYDGGTRCLNYVNCGQEPALLRRAVTGALEMLLPTGPILGMAETAEYAQATVTLEPGDAVVIFTDGLTEVGPSRREMLEIGGVMRLLQADAPDEDIQTAEQKAEHFVLRLIAGVDGYAQGGIRDDMCLLVGVAEG